jgi:hypothetical protein
MGGAPLTCRVALHIIICLQGLSRHQVIREACHGMSATVAGAASHD